MMHRLLFIAVNLLAVLPLPAQPADIKHIALHLQFDWEKKQAAGTAKIILSPAKAGSSFALDAGFLNIESLSVNDKAAVFQYNGGDEPLGLKITAGQVYQPGETVELFIRYHTNYINRADPNAIAGSFGKGLRFQQPTAVTPMKRKQAWSSGEPEGNKYWFPCIEDIADIHTTEISATLEKPLMLISNGQLTGVIDNLNGTQTFHYRSADAFPNYQVFIAVGEYACYRQQAGGTTINNYGYPDEMMAVKSTTAMLPRMLQFLEEKTGYRYPFRTYSQVVVQDYPFPGKVGQYTASLLSDNYIDDEGVHSDFKYLWDGVAMQALANQWFGSLLMPKQWNDIWLCNAFAQYFAGLYTEKDNGRSEYLLWYYPFEKASVWGDVQAGLQHAIVPDTISDIAAFTTDSYSKYRGALVLRMLQAEMGDEHWWKTVKRFIRDNAHRQVTTADLQHAAEAVTGKSYQWFFDQWMYKTGWPVMNITRTYKAKEKQLVIHIQQQPDTGIHLPQVHYFSGNMKIEIDKKIVTVNIKAQPATDITIPAAQAPRLVNCNMEQVFLGEIIQEKTNEEYLLLATQSRDVLAKQDAVNHLVTAAADTGTAPAFKTTIINTLVALLNKEDYWRFRMNVLIALGKIVQPPYNKEMVALLKRLIATSNAWLKATAISVLGRSGDAAYSEIYKGALYDKSDRVINAAAVALGKTKRPEAFALLMELEKRRSWKNQNRISALNGLQQLGDTAAAAYALQCISDNRSPRWYLATPVWDYPFAAVSTLVALGRGEQAYPILLEQFKRSLKGDDINDIFQYLQLIDLLADKRAKEVYAMLKEKFKTDAPVLEAVKNYEQQYLERIKE